MSFTQKAPWKQLGDEALRKYQAEKEQHEKKTIHYCLSDVGMAQLQKKKALATLAKAKKTKTSSPVKANLKAKVKVQAKAASARKSTKTAAKVRNAKQ